MPSSWSARPTWGGRGCPVELIRHGERGAGIAVKDPMAIGVGGGGEAIAPDQMAEQEEVALGILLGAKDAPEHLPRRIVDRCKEDKTGAALLKPVTVAPVQLDEAEPTVEKNPGLTSIFGDTSLAAL